jgi:hypothetical protein
MGAHMNLQATIFASVAIASCAEAKAPPPPSPLPKFACGTVEVTSINGGVNLPGGPCKIDADCKDRPAGRCVVLNGDKHESPVVGCVYDECTSDRDCKAGTVCICGSGRGTSRNACLPGNCHAATLGESSECGAFACIASVSPLVVSSSRSIEGYFCRTREDQCRSDRDCDLEGGSACTYRRELGRFTCVAIAHID